MKPIHGAHRVRSGGAPLAARPQRLYDGRPALLSGIRPYVDGRGDMYGDELVVGYYRIAQGDPKAFDRRVTRWNIRWAILPLHSKLIPLLDRTPGWRRVRQDKVGAIYVRGAT